MPDEVLGVQALTKRFGGLLALDRVELSVRAGEIFGVIGPNGAGKTTLFSCLVGALAPTSGSVRFKGERIDGRPTHAIVKSKQDGLRHVLYKPFNVEQMTNALRNVPPGPEVKTSVYSV